MEILMRSIQKLLIGSLCSIFIACSNHADETKKSKKDKAVKTEKATFGGGCFWCVEAIYENVEGVVSVVSGYEGGQTENPTYKQITTGKTGHAEVVQIEFDPKVVSFERLLDVFFSTHDPTTLNRQGNDKGTQYRSIVFYHSDAQKKETEAAIKRWNESKTYKDPIVTKVEATQKFYKAEGYHQDYFENNPTQGYCRVVIQPKVEKFLKAEKLRREKEGKK